MSVAEYVAAFVSIMIGLALADLVTSTQRLLRAATRVKWDLLAPATALLVTAFIINVWWATYGSLLAIKSLSVAAFLPDLVTLLLLFSLASSALPDQVDEDGLDLASYYDANRRWFWGSFILYMTWITSVVAARAITAGAPWGRVAGATVPNIVLMCLTIPLLFTGRRWVHLSVIAILLLTAGLAWLPQEIAAPAGRTG